MAEIKVLATYGGWSEIGSLSLGKTRTEIIFQVVFINLHICCAFDCFLSLEVFQNQIEEWVQIEQDYGESQRDWDQKEGVKGSLT